MLETKMRRAPIEGVDFSDRVFIDKKKGRGVRPLKQKEQEIAARDWSQEAIETGEPIWLNPEKDSKELNIHQRPYRIKGRALHVLGEMAIFPPAQDATDKDQDAA